ncbi:DUF2818 family protein [Tepidimonas charontis]|uniref:DUF2818 family protein n=1 Tax=Tepidimonas charontis TaxID=2267262 RepID=A0A554XCR1_9BURK|nr:DUF2818 family protein [Tepidimonas charontis]TSE33637.1 hypothetical protein Tchar_01699 [Tepidimonas charontis]
MSLQSAVYAVIVLALIAANLPFLSNRWLLLWPAGVRSKPLWGRLAELVLWYFIVGAVALGLEQHLGQRYPQGWEFYAITAAMFLTFAFPGFVLRYLLRR